MKPAVYRISAVDGTDDDTKEILLELHKATLGDDCPLVAFNRGHWWIVFADGEPVAFAGLYPSFTTRGHGYLIRCGVLKKHGGRGLQRRLIRVRERKARSLGWTRLVSYTIQNPPSANNLIRCGFLLFTPKNPWSIETALYWAKDLT